MHRTGPHDNSNVPTAPGQAIDDCGSRPATRSAIVNPQSSIDNLQSPASHPALAAKPTGSVGPIALIALLALQIGFVPIPRDPDLWFHLADGEYILAQGQVPQTDPFSFTREGQLWVPHSWLFDVAVTLGWRNLGPATVEAVMAVVFMLTIMISLGMLTARGVSPFLAAAICVVLAFAANGSRGLRPQAFSLLACNVVLYLLVRHRHRPGLLLLYVIPPLFLLWAQVHAACVMGLVVMTIWVAGRCLQAAIDRSWRLRSRELVIALASLGAATLAILITPHRISHFAYVAQTWGIEHLNAIDEWQAPKALSLHPPHVYIYLLIGCVIVLLARRGRRVGWAETGVCVALLILGLSGIRHVPLACLGAVPLIAASLGRGRRRVWVPLAAGPPVLSNKARADELSVAPCGSANTVGDYAPAEVRVQRRWIIPVAALAIVMVLLRQVTREDVFTRYAREEPVKGAQALADLDRDLRVFTTYNTGSYVLYAAHQGRRYGTSATGGGRYGTGPWVKFS